MSIGFDSNYTDTNSMTTRTCTIRLCRPKENFLWSKPIQNGLTIRHL